MSVCALDCGSLLPLSVQAALLPRVDLPLSYDFHLRKSGGCAALGCGQQGWPRESGRRLRAVQGAGPCPHAPPPFSRRRKNFPASCR